MSYAIAEIVFGLNLTDIDNLPANSLLANVDKDELEEFVESGYVESAYSGNGDEPRWFGVNMGDFSEGNNIRADQLLKELTVTDEQKAEYDAKLNALRADEDWSQVLRDSVIGESAAVWLLWGSS